MKRSNHKIKTQIALRNAAIAIQKMNCPVKCNNRKSNDELPCEMQQSQIKRRIALRHATIANKKRKEKEKKCVYRPMTRNDHAIKRQIAL